MTKIDDTNFDALELNHPSSIDIVTSTAMKINSSELNVYDDSQVNWEEVTMYNMNIIKWLLSKIDTLFLEDTADAIIKSIDSKYDPTNPYDRPQVWSSHYDPQVAILCEQGDWDYEGAIKTFVEQLIKKRQKKEEYQKKLEQRKQNENKKNAPPSSAIPSDLTEKILEKAMLQIESQNQKDLISILTKMNNFNIENSNLTCGPYEIAQGKKTAFMSVIWVLKELGFFVKKADGSYATNRSDVIDSFLAQKGNADQLLPKSLKTDTFMNVFNDMFNKASEMYSKDNKK